MRTTFGRMCGRMFGTTRRRVLGAAAVLLLGAGAVTLEAQRFGMRRDAMPEPVKLPYDGRFTFARIRFENAGAGSWDIKWAHDYPVAERNFMQILSSISTVRPTMEGTVLTLDDPDIFRYPILYLCEPGYWQPTDEEAARLGTYLRKGGFIIFDDFFDRHWYNFAEQMQRVLPGARPMPIPPDHPIFDSFFRITEVDFALHRGSGRGGPQYLGIFEDDDPTKRLMAMINFDNDIGEYMEYSGTGFTPVDVSNTAYKFGVNYLVYAMTH